MLEKIYEQGEEIKLIRTDNNFSVKKLYPGGMGIVYQAMRSKDRKLYALKTVKFRTLFDKSTRLEKIDGFRWESLVWMILGKHPNIVQAHWFDFDSFNQPFLVMEFIEGDKRIGTDLYKWIEHDALPIELTIKFSQDVVKGLLYAKQIIQDELDMPFVHCDLKPQNILVTHNKVAKVTDLGTVKSFAQHLDLKLKKGNREQIHFSGRGGMTPVYAAPEQWKGEALNEKTDVYAMGCTMYEMVCGYPPFNYHTIERLKIAHLKERPKSPQAKNNNVPEPYSRLILSCLEKEKESRPSLDELLDQLLALDYPAEKVQQVGQPIYTAEDYNSLGSGFAQLKFHNKAIEYFDRAINLDSGDARFYLNRGSAYFSLAELDKAKYNYEKSLEVNHQFAQAFINLAHVLARKQQFQEAIENYTKAITINNRISEAFIGRGITFAHCSQLINAEEDLLYALKLNPHSIEAHLNLGNIYRMMNQYFEAERCYLSAIALNPEYLEAYKNLVDLYKAWGKFENAMIYDEKAQAIKGHSDSEN